MNSVERLRQYYPFDDDVMEAVESAAGQQHGCTFKQLADRYDVADGYEHPPVAGKPIEVLTLRPNDDYDVNHARVYHTPMAMPVENMVTRAFRLFAADPSSQLIMIGNPTSIGNRYNKLPLSSLRQVAKGNFDPVVEPHLEYLASRRINTVDQIGYSWGADKAAAASGELAGEKYGINVRRGILMEPVSVIKRSLLNLLADFKSAEPQLANYQSAAYNPPLNEKPSSALQGYLDFVKYVGGLVRPGNLAIEAALARDGFAGRVTKALAHHRDLRVAIAWGTASELVPEESIASVVEALQARQHEARRIGRLALNGMHHAGADNIDLHAAIVLQAYRLLED